MKEIGFNKTLRVSDIVLLYEYFIENVKVTDDNDAFLLTTFNQLCQNISRKVELRAQDTKQLAIVLLGIVTDIREKELFFMDGNLLMIALEAAINLISAQSMHNNHNVVHDKN
jgi:hypothetical protein